MQADHDYAATFTTSHASDIKTLMLVTCLLNRHLAEDGTVTACGATSSGNSFSRTDIYSKIK